MVLHLAGCKKVQQQLSRSGVVERLLGDDAKAAELRRCFAHMYPADAVARGELKEVREAVLKDPLRFVLKPQREGGSTSGERRSWRRCCEATCGCDERG